MKRGTALGRKPLIYHPTDPPLDCHSRSLETAQHVIGLSSTDPASVATPDASVSVSEAYSTVSTEAMYTPSEELTACVNPERDAKNLGKQFQSKQWDERFGALNTVRKLAYHHADILWSNILDLCRYIGVEINSLRSTLSRMALMTLTDLFVCFGRKLETNKCLDALMPNLMRRAGEMSNEFISCEADKAVYAMIERISMQKSLPILLSHSKTKSPPIRAKVAMYLGKIVTVAGSSILNSRDYERLIRTAGAFLNDSAVNTRNYSKRILIRLNQLNEKNNSKSDFDRKLKTCLNLQQFNKVQTVLTHAHEINLNSDLLISPKFKKPLLRSSVNSVNDLSSEPQQASASTTTNANPIMISNRMPSRSHRKPLQPENQSNASSYEDSGNDEVPAKFSATYTGLISSDWKKRLSALHELCDLSEQHPEYTASNVVHVMDRVAEKLSDSNAKVAIAAINHLRSMVQRPHIRALLPRIVKIITEPLCCNMAAANPSIRKNSEEAIDELMCITEPGDVVAHIASVITFSNSRVKHHCLPKLTDAVFKMKMKGIDKNVNAMLTNSVLPAIKSLLETSKTSTQSELKKLVRIVYSVLGQAMFDSGSHANNLKTDQLMKLQAMLNR